ncbi:hypothetical protein ACTHRK_00410 [Dietzia cercidiphylli]|uniref:hypothetical protein n=1 Tax=Dietzia cercidiphylli TaxID=498199 RepID=UPI003F818690
MPDFSAISAALTAVKNLIDGVIGFTGSISGTDTIEAVDALFGSLGATDQT